MERLYILILLVGCSGGEQVPAAAAIAGSGGKAIIEPEAGRPSSGAGQAPTAGAGSTGGETIGPGGESSGGSAVDAGGAPQAGQTSGGAAVAGSSGEPTGGFTAGSGGSSGGAASGGASGSAGASSGAGSGGGSSCPGADQAVWKIVGSACYCNGQCNRKASECTGMVGKSCLNETTCGLDCYKPTPESCGSPNVWHQEAGACMCGSCVKGLTCTKPGNQCLISLDGLTCQEAC